MKATGIVRRIDELGRIVLPIELRQTMDIEERDRVEIYLEGDLIIVRKFEQTCLFCGTARNLIAFKEKSVCRDCIRALNKKPTIKRRASYAQTAEAPNIRCFRCLPKISRNRKAYGDCTEDTIVGCIAKEYAGKKEGMSVFDPVFVLSAILDWAGIAHNERGYLELTAEYRTKAEGR